MQLCRFLWQSRQGPHVSSQIGSSAGGTLCNRNSTALAWGSCTGIRSWIAQALRLCGRMASQYVPWGFLFLTELVSGGGKCTLRLRNLENMACVTDLLGNAVCKSALWT